MLPLFTAPPAPQSFFRRAGELLQFLALSGKPLITDTALPPRPATSRPTRTRAPGAGFAGAG